MDGQGGEGVAWQVRDEGSEELVRNVKKHLRLAGVP
jgi:hypothetical protein